MKTRWISLIVLLALVLAGCGPGNNLSVVETQAPPSFPSTDSTKPTENPPLSTPLPDSPTQGEPMNPTAPEIQKLIALAVEDLAKRLSIPTDQIQLKEAAKVVWPNSSIGCPQPGMLYADVLTAGYLILLNADGRDYEYHAGKDPQVIYCENPTPPVPGMPDDV